MSAAQVYSTKHRAKMIGTCEEGMAMKRYRVKLSAEERQGTEDIGVPWPGGGLQADPRARPPFSRGQALLLSDEAHADGAMKDEG